MEDPRCFNHHCLAVLGVDDLYCKDAAGKLVPAHRQLCPDCWERFDGQKMRGRFKGFGLTHNDAVAITAAAERMSGGRMLYSLGHPSDEARYTEDIEEWCEWQVPREEDE